MSIQPEAEEVRLLEVAAERVRRSVKDLFSDVASDIEDLFSVDDLPGLPKSSQERVREFVVGPVREIADRGGKGWRSNIMLVACEALGGNPSLLHPWVGVIELLHVGSLIIDDVQDESMVRRGGPSCHVSHGVPAAINAGTCAYFLFDKMVQAVPLDDAVRAQLYRLYFQCMRSAHAGQALDIAGVRSEAHAASVSGDNRELLAAISTIHRLKTGVPVVLCLLIGAFVAGANATQRAGLTRFGSDVGLAFQIGDDILNLRGFERPLKELGEDIRAGKITYPVAVALGELGAPARAELHSRIEACDGAPENVRRVLELLDQADAYDRSRRAAEQMLDTGFAELLPLLTPGPATDALRAYGTFLLERHY